MPNVTSNVPLNAENLNSALCCISGIQTSSTLSITPEIIKEAENVLLFWEGSNPSAYAVSLLNVITKPLSESEHVGMMTPRLGAALSLKALVGRKWKDRGRLSKKKALILLDNGTKQHIRVAILGLLTSSTFNGQYSIDPFVCVALARDRPIVITLSSILAKIGSFDLPLEFKELIPTLVGFSTGDFAPIDSSITVEIRTNAANALEFTLSELCAKRLLIYKKYVSSIASTHIPSLVANGFHYAVDHLKNSDAQNLPQILRYTLSMSKILNHLIQATLSSLSNAVKTSQNNDMIESMDARKAIDQVFQLLLEYIPLLCNRLYKKESLTGTGGDGFNDDLLEQLKDLLAEFHSMVVLNQKTHPIAFARYLPPFLTLFAKDLEMMVVNNDTEAYLAIPRMKFLANVISCSHYEPDESNNESIETWKNEVTRDNNTRHAISSKGDVSIDPNSISAAIENVWSKFLTTEQTNSLVKTSLHFMTLSENLLNEWSNDGELFYIERKNANADEDVIACAQNLYLSLLESKCRETVIAGIAPFLFRVDEQIEAVNVEIEKRVEEVGYAPVLYWDAVYTALGLSLEALRKTLNFDVNNWFISSLSQVLKALTKQVSNKPERLPILRKRLIWLCGFNYMNTSQHAYQILFPLLQDHLTSEYDAVVQLSAIQSLTNIVIDPPSNFTVFLHFPDQLVKMLYTLVLQFNELDSKSDCLTLLQLLLSMFLNRGLKIDNQQHVSLLIQPLDRIWKLSEQNEFLMLRSSVLSILKCIAAFGHNTVSVLNPIAFPLLNHALDTRNDENQFLIGDALELWLTIIRVANPYENYFSSIFNRIIELLEQDFEHLKKSMLITEAYVIVGGKSFIQEQSSTLITIFELTLTEVTARGMAYVNLVFEALLKQNPAFGGSILLSSGILAKMIKSCARSYANEKNCESHQVIEIYLTIFSRIFLAIPTEIAAFMSTLEQHNLSLSQMVNFYFMLFDSTDPLRRKLWIMFILSLLVPTATGQLPDDIILADVDYLNKILHICLRVLQEKASLTPYQVEVFYESDDECIILQEERFEHSVQVLCDKDIGFNTNFHLFYSRTMQELERALTGSKFEKTLQKMNQKVVNQINESIQSP